MDLSGGTVLITGGGTGIGFELAQRFVQAGSTVLICGRREEKLAEARGRVPELRTRACDIAREEDRRSLYGWAIDNGVSILVNNAGIQREVDFTRGLQALTEGDSEIRINLEGTVYLTALLVPHLMTRENAAIVNVSSGLAFVPLAIMPVYCATKAAIHSFSVSMRRQLASSGIRVFEVIPPTVDTDLDRGARARRGQAHRGIPPEDVGEEAMRGMAEDRPEIAVGRAADLMSGSRTNFEQVFRSMNGEA